MCGIFGIVSPEGEKPTATLVEKATDSLWHRGPDDSGFFFDKNVALGNRRLAILDLSKEGQMPMTSENLTITYNGELYNYIELRSELQKLGHQFKSQTDTEVILAAYKEWGNQCEHHFNGMWAFAIYDQEKSILFCSRDRFGIKPFFYQLRNNTFVFASEIKALKTLPSWKFEVNEQMAGDFIFNGFQHHTDQTLFEGVLQLRPGHQLIYDCKENQHAIHQYYNLDNISQKSKLTFVEAKSKFKDLLSDSIRLHQRSDVKIGAALSGGLDSSTLVALLAEQLAEDAKGLETVSYASTISEFDESKYVDDLLKKYRVTFHRTTSDFKLTMDLLDEVIKAHDEPLLSASLIAQYLVFKKAKSNNLKVMLDGQGADEILAGYGTYYAPYWKELIRSKPWKLLPEIFGVVTKHGIDLKAKLTGKLTDGYQFIKFKISQLEPSNNGFNGYEKYMISKGILPYLLHFDDRNSMAHSVESRVPFLDYRLVEFCLSLPPDFKIKNGVRKHILRKAFEDKLPESILNRFDKMGFPTPQNYWMKRFPEYFIGKLAKIVERFPDRVEKGYLEFAKDALRNGRVGVFAGIWRVISFFRWMEMEIDSKI